MCFKDIISQDCLPRILIVSMRVVPGIEVFSQTPLVIPTVREVQGSTFADIPVLPGSG